MVRFTIYPITDVIFPAPAKALVRESLSLILWCLVFLFDMLDRKMRNVCVVYMAGIWYMLCKPFLSFFLGQ